MLTIYKYPITINDRVRIDLPRGAEILAVQVQHGQPCMWAKVDTDKPTIPWYFRVFGTGHQITRDLSNTLRYVATFQVEGGSLVFHLFQEFRVESEAI